MSKIEFKEFVRKNPSLIDSVKNNTTTWQKLYELYDLYGEKSEIWDKYLKSGDREEKTSNENSSLSLSNNFKDLLGLVKNVDLNTVQRGLSSLDKAIEAFKGIIPSSDTNPKVNYEPRPTYKYFED